MNGKSYFPNFKVYLSQFKKQDRSTGSILLCPFNAMLPRNVVSTYYCRVYGKVLLLSVTTLFMGKMGPARCGTFAQLKPQAFISVSRPRNDNREKRNKN